MSSLHLKQLLGRKSGPRQRLMEPLSSLERVRLEQWARARREKVSHDNFRPEGVGE